MGIENMDWESISALAGQWGMKLGIALVILVVGRWLSKAATALFRRFLRRARVDETLINFGANIVYIVLLTVVFIAALNKIGVQTASLVAILGAAGLAVGLALQGSLSNFAAGIMIIAFRPFKSGDFVEAAGVSGNIKDINIFTTTLLTPDNKTIIVPNSNITTDNIINYSKQKMRRVDLVFGISYDDDMRKAKSILEKTLKADKRVLEEPKPVIAVDQLAASSVNLACRPWVKTEDYWDVYWDLTEKVKEAFDKGGVTIPYQQHDVRIFHSAPEKAGK